MCRYAEDAPGPPLKTNVTGRALSSRRRRTRPRRSRPQASPSCGEPSTSPVAVYEIALRPRPHDAVVSAPFGGSWSRFWLVLVVVLRLVAHGRAGYPLSTAAPRCAPVHRPAPDAERREECQRGGERRPSVVPGPARGRAPARSEPLAVGREVAARDPALRRARVPVAHLPRAHDRRVLRDPVHGPLPARDLRLQPGRAPLDVACRVLLVRRARDRPVPALHARRRPRLPGTTPRRLPGATLARSRPREVVAPRDPAVHPRRDLPRKLRLRGLASGRVGLVVPGRPRRAAR